VKRLVLARQLACLPRLRARQPQGPAKDTLPPARRFLSTTTATSYSLVGSLNKIPVAVIGLVAFNVPWNAENLASILVGLFAGIIFVKAKQMPPAK